MSFLRGNIGESLWLNELSKTHTDIEKAPNKKFYDPRAWLRSGETAFVERLTRSFEDLNCLNRNSA